ncbi:DUF1972 domain-containing protein [Priestia megaterium]|uniref:beta 1-4 rhamnosyltransferase Cps2T n=1 Tax=Priestia megaterium TaxID=1404 RepID=UPI0021ACD609|nr:DUF1972 domain-containing protein [Priestia megaterium]MCR8929541.1 DUF1972 domain-containing protein [Priestia megaterium]
MRNIFIIGSKGIPSKYGGFETFVDKLTEYKMSKEIKYHVACLGNNEQEFEYNDARCFNIKVPQMGSARAILYDLKALNKVYNYIKQNSVENPIVYILACRIGPFIKIYQKKFNELGVPILLNPDGHEWKRAKWSAPVRAYWKLSERMMIKYTDLAICDSKAIQQYIIEDYVKYQPQTTFIAYGATVSEPHTRDHQLYCEWLEKWSVSANNYYLIVGRFVPENNYELMIKEFMASDTKKSLIIVTNVENNKFYIDLKKKTGFEKDPRIKFVGTIYNQELLYEVRINAFGYLHGHEVGGTNPSLLEALATTPLNLLLDVAFNKEVGGDAGLYFKKENNSLSDLISLADVLTTKDIQKKEFMAKKRIHDEYSWDIIVKKYETIFLGV